jgi:integrase
MPRRPTERRKLQDAWVRHAGRTEDRSYLVWDSRQPALAVQFQAAPSSHRAFKVIYRFHGRPRWFTIGDATKISVEDARRQATVVMGQVSAERDPAAEKKTHRGDGTFGQLREKYLEECAKKRNKSWRQGKKLADGYLAKWDRVQASSVTKSDVKALHRALGDRPSLANQVLAAASAIFSWAVREDVAGVTVNPCAGIERRETSERERVLDDGEVPRVWAALRDVDPVKCLALRTVLLTGQRPGEVAAMRREHVRDGWWLMPGEPDPKTQWPGTKNSRSHRVFLARALRDMLDLDGGEGFVFANSQGNSVGPLDDAMRNVSAALRLDEAARPHDLRRTFGTTVASLEYTRDDMDRILNHVKRSVTDIYDRHKYAKRDERIMEAVCARLLQLAEGRPADNVVALRSA